ncbi:cytochrome ubiquinol oxidase subunit I [Dictyobacter sp. S3.2.2.5]|uniref:Cytochrome ubiquinol oxidase subunit I n=1 Tax=Dictyobacter halimunensis TaxID=3026934 RepID=A0ABQ6FUU9_9CHLR|nr:cytochrome ubiquinol oxidase subunit I [Dictyobacter sp. S3.2.2.5]
MFWTNLLAARTQMGVSFVFHIIFSVLGVGLPVLLCISEGLALFRKDAHMMMLARQWTRAFAILFAIGAVSGTIVEFEISLVWPIFAGKAGAIIGLPFATEGFAFFMEGIFLGLYLYGWGRLSPKAHWLCSFPIVLSGSSSAWFITSANSWMNSPTGFQMVNGKVTNIDPFAAILNPSTPFETVHMILACYVATGLGAAAIYAFGMLRGKRDDYHRRGLLIGLALGGIAIPLQIACGDLNARSLEDTQPAKYAAMEGVMQSGNGLPLYIGGIPDPNTKQTRYAIIIPQGESLLSHFTINSHTTGFDAFPPADRPDPVRVHLAFDAMVGCGFFIFFISALFWFLYLKRKGRIPENKWLLRGVIVAGVCGFLAVELGWITTEEGRQPWIVYNIMRVGSAVTPNPLMTISLIVFSCIYILLGVTLVAFLILIARRREAQRSWSELIVKDTVKAEPIK